MSTGWLLLARIETVARNVTVVVPSDKTGRDILLAAIVTVVGSVAVAFIAAATAGKRQKRALTSADSQHKESLTAQGGQHTESLDAEHVRLTQRLEHERKLQDVQHLRGFFDEVGAAFEEALSAQNFLAVWKSAPETPGLDERAQAALNARLGVEIALDRVALRFDERDAVFRAYKEVSDLIAKRANLLFGGSTPLTDEEAKKIRNSQPNLDTRFESSRVPHVQILRARWQGHKASSAPCYEGPNTRRKRASAGGDGEPARTPVADCS